MPAAKIHLFGTLQVVVGDRAISIPHGALASLLGYLALHASTRSVSRSRVAGTLWAEQPELRARRTLTDTLRRLRRWIGETESWLIADDESITLRDVWLDVDEFRARADSGDAAEARAALSLYSGDLLEDLDAEWILSRRADLREKYLLALEKVCRALISSENFPEAILIAHRWTLADPLHEEACRTAMRLYARLGRYAAALQQYDRLKGLLADELRVEPLAETRALAESIRAEYQSSSLDEKAHHAFIGRRKERATLLQIAERAQNGRGGLVFVEGEPGIGKTRLLESFAEGAAWRGLTVTWGRARELNGVPPYAPLDESLQTLVTGPRLDQLRGRLASEVIETLSALIPHLKQTSDVSKTSEVLRKKRIDLPSALALAITTLSEIAPHVFIFDDVQWAGAAFWEALQKIAPTLGDARVLFVLSYRSDEARIDSTAWRALRDLDREFAPERIILNGLTSDECSELAHTLGQTLEGDNKQTLHVQSGGNPFFVQELIMQKGDEQATLSQLLARRLSNLIPSARQALECGAVLGREFAHGAWQALVGDPLIAAIPNLIAARFIEETDRGYAFQHDLAREHVYRALDHNRRRDLHYRAGEALSRESAEPSVLAWHFEQAEAWREAVRYHREAGDRAAKVYAHDAALNHYARAEDLLPHLEEPQTERLTILRSRLRVLHTVLREAEMLRTAEELERAAIELDEPAALVESLEARISIYVLGSKWNEMRETAERAIALVESIGDARTEARLRRLLGWHLSDALGQPRESLPHLTRAIEIAGQIKDDVTLAMALGDLAFTQRLLGQQTHARQTATRAMAFTQDQPHLQIAHALAMQTLAQVEIDLAHWESAFQLLQKVITVQRDLGDPWSLGQAIFGVALVAARMGQRTESLKHIEWVRSILLQSPAEARVNYLMWVDALDAESLVLIGELESAEKILAAMQSWIETTDAGRALLLALTAMGRLRLAQGRSAEADSCLARAVNIWEQMGSTVEIAPLLLYVIAAQRNGDSDSARAALTRAEAMLQPNEVVCHNILLHYARFQLTNSKDDLAAAHAELQRQASLFTDDQMRSDFLNQLTLHREIESCWRAVSPPTAPVIVHLARADAPLGKTLTDEDRVEVRWTVDAGESDQMILEREGKAALRLHRIRRLLNEARAQGAAPTDKDIAQALGVNVRTIERDMVALRSKGQFTSTRRRKP